MTRTYTGLITFRPVFWTRVRARQEGLTVRKMTTSSRVARGAENVWSSPARSKTPSGPTEARRASIKNPFSVYVSRCCLDVFWGPPRTWIVLAYSPATLSSPAAAPPGMSVSGSRYIH